MCVQHFLLSLGRLTFAERPNVCTTQAPSVVALFFLFLGRTHAQNETQSFLGIGMEKEIGHLKKSSCSMKLLQKYEYGHFSDFISSVRGSNSHPDLLLTQQHPLFQITPVLNTGLSLSEPLQLYKGYNAI